MELRLSESIAGTSNLARIGESEQAPGEVRVRPERPALRVASLRETLGAIPDREQFPEVARKV